MAIIGSDLEIARLKIPVSLGKRLCPANRAAHRNLGGQQLFVEYRITNARGTCARAKWEDAALEFIFGLIVLALDIWAIINIIGSTASTGAKILWTLLIIILPIVGFIIWFFAGPRSRTSTA